jgi:hypothetical protein
MTRSPREVSARAPRGATAASFATAVSLLFAAQLCLPLPAQTPSVADKVDHADRVDPASATATQPAYTPVTETQRFTGFLKDTFSPLSLVRSAASAGIGQWRDSPHQWKQGGEGYGRRYASSYAQHIVNATLMYGVSSVLHEDNRYVRSGQSGVKTRVGYALKTRFMARGEDGTQHLSVSRICALAGASLISRLWQPQGTDRLRSAGINFGTSIGFTMGFGVAKEFWPRK